MAHTEVAQEPLSQIERVVDAFVTPTATFRDILRSASWWVPFVLVAISAVLVAVSIDRRVGFEQVVENQIRLVPSQSAQLQQLEPDAREARLQAIATGYRYTTYGSPAILLFFSGVAALVLWGSVNFGLGARATYKQMLAVWMYASLPRLLTSVATMVTLWFGSSPDSFNIRQPAGTNAGYYLTDSPLWLTTLLSFFDVIGLWCLGLLIVGTAIVAKVGRGAAATVVLGWWVIVVIVSVGMTAAFR